MHISRLMLCALSVGAAAGASAQVTPQQGRLEFRWGDPQPGSAQQSRFELDLLDDSGVRTPLDASATLAAAGNLFALNRRPVAATMQPGPWVGGKATPEVVIDAAPGQPDAIITGSQPWVTLLCKFSDSAAEPSFRPATPSRLTAAWPPRTGVANT